MTSDRADLERQLWRAVEAVHAVVYFAPEAKAAYAGVGLRGFWMGYFASRVAALGAVGPQVTTALFFGFAPRMVQRALPRAWELAAPHEVLAARAEVARTVLGRFAGVDVAPAANALTAAADGLDLAGRPLAAAHAAALAEGPDALGALWRAATVLREYRGDGHIAALVAEGVDGVQANVWTAAGGVLVPEQREFRGWTEQEWAGAAAALRRRGWLDGDGMLTPAGREVRAEVERRTDRAAAPALARLDDAALRAVAARLVPVASAIAQAGAVPYPNAMGVPAPRAISAAPAGS
ncbi:SCO6745 family protein [Pseudonocardia nigra]|uniref:SCO6745 family protein n=1 Tax=Pseudonocardia nigra TaxID=1921578 RepID=UPI001C5E6F63|nr:hypothetical protein [Pseudonocardia nigra]